MTSEDNINSSRSEIFYPRALPRLWGSASEHNVYYTYVCLINDVNPKLSINTTKNRTESFHLLDGAEEVLTDDEPIQVERSKAVHELVQSRDKNYGSSSGTGKPSTTDSCHTYGSNDNPKVLKLTKMKWLTEDDEGTDSSSPSISPARSSTSSNISQDSGDEVASHPSLSEKYLSTILRLDKEHNMFGLSNIAIVGTKPSKKIKKDDDKPVFHQTAIVQFLASNGCCSKICCSKMCCNHRTNSDLPSSLKCGRCTSCSQCSPPCYSKCSLCVSRCPSVQPCPVSQPRANPTCKNKCTCKQMPMIFVPKPCATECCYGLTIKLNKKPKFEPPAVELTPRNSCILQRPYISRPCPHTPKCCPPSSCFPYLMPCFWPSRPSAPCHDPTKCFHNPACMPPRRHRPRHIAAKDVCSKPCVDAKKHKTCTNSSCLGKNKVFKQSLEARYGAKSQNSGKKGASATPPATAAKPPATAAKPPATAAKPPATAAKPPGPPPKPPPPPAPTPQK